MTELVVLRAADDAALVAEITRLVGFLDRVKNLRTDAVRKHVDGIVRQEPTRIDHGKLMALVVRILVMAVARHAVPVRDNGGPAAQYAIEERGLPYVRASDNTYDR